MLDKILKVFLGDPSQRTLKEVQPYIDQVHAAEQTLSGLTDRELRGETESFRARLRTETEVKAAERDQLRLQAESELDVDAKEALYRQIDSLDKDILAEEERILLEILPRAYAVLRETARRLSERPLRVPAQDWDRELGSRLDAVSIEGDTAVWNNSWSAAGNPITWNMVHYDVQLFGGVVLHKGRIAEMATGEGKTLVATLPVYLNALSGRGVHLVTVNDYLSKRDSEWMGPLYQFHGLSVDCIDKHRPNTEPRRKAYLADITFGTNNEFGFDYLRDNMARETAELVQRGHHYAIVDEVDSVLIDDARTPLIISGPTPNGDQQEFDYLKNFVVALMNQQKAVAQDALAKAKEALAAGDKTEAGFQLLRSHRALPKNKALIKFLSEDGVKAMLQKTEGVYLQDQGKEMKKIDEALYFTIEEKHNQVNLTNLGLGYLAEQTSTDFFVLPVISVELDRIEKAHDDVAERAARRDQLMREYRAKSERIHSMNQLLKAYSLFEKDVEYVVMEGKVKIVDEQTGRIMDGRRYSDGLHQAIEAKEGVTIEAATQTYATITLQNYFRMYHKLSGMTGTAETEAGEFWEIYKLEVTVIPTNVAAKRDDRNDLVFKTKREKYNAVIDEIEKLRNAGRPVLVGTTSVEISELLSRTLNIRKIPHQVLNAKLHQKEADIVAEAGRPGTVTIATNMAGRGTDIKLTAESKAAGGLAIIGTERHDSRRVDRQLRGRAGRQGDPGSSQFFVSLEDNLMRLFGSERIAGLMDRMGHKEGDMIEHSMVTKSIERAQKKVEENNFGSRKRLLEYDDVMNAQRSGIYRRRRNALSGERLSLDLANSIYDAADSLVSGTKPSRDFGAYELGCFEIFAMATPVDSAEFERLSAADLTQKTYAAAQAAYRAKCDRIAGQALPVLENVLREQGGQFQNILVPFTDGIKSIQIPTNLQRAVETRGQSLTTDLEKAIVLSMIDEHWKEHLRNMDDLRQNVQGAVYEQKDPLLVYKHESFKLFKDMVDEMNASILGFLFRAGLPQAEPGQAPVRQAPAAPARPAQQLTTSGPGAEEAPASRGTASRSATPPPAAAPKQAPAVSSKKYGRNDQVTIVNLMTGEQKQVKFKVAEPLLAQGWQILG
ncbi:MAG: preprotein translocase subunit SecA [Cryomorphaceae bacterium BACL18 MAG-120924-bin36]|nr:MAG: preprotein translocase subunit SecA [Cryomorphaceae bacterium BACL18 MAG-120924-bin36]